MYIATLLIPAIPYLLMIYYPEKVDPIYKYLFSENIIYTSVITLNIVFIFLYFCVIHDLAQNGMHANWLPYVKLYFVVFGVVSTALLLVFDSVLIVKPVLYSSIGGVLIFYIWMHYAKKT